MRAVGIRHRRLLQATALAAAPGAAALAALWLAGALGGGPMLAAAAGVTALAALMAWRFLDDVGALLVRLDDIAIGELDQAPLETRTGLAGDMAEAVLRQRRRVIEVQAALESRAAAAESVIDGVPEPLLVVSRERRIAHANLAAETLLGGNLVGRDLAEVVRSAAVIENVDLALGDGRARAVDFPLTAPVDRELRARVALLDRSGDAGEAAVIALEDLTAIRRAEQMRVDFVANVSHELKTPVATLRGFIETLLGPARDDAEARERFLAIMSDQARRMERLVEDLLSLSRIELDEHVRPRGRVDLAELIRADAEALALMAEARDMRIEVDFPPGLPPVMGEAHQLSQVFRNLIENAVKYGRPGSAVEVSGALAPSPLSAGPRMVAVSVRDHGDGIPRHHLPRLTERFYRVDPARSRAAGGTGLGLAIVKHILNRHRGQLSIESEVGRGSAFTVRLPVHPEAAARPAAAGERRPQALSSK